MSKLHLLNLVLFVIVVSLACLIYFSEVPDTRLQQLTDIDPATISSIKIQHNNKTTSIHKKDGNQWQITQPVLTAANNFRISSILKLLQAPVHKRYEISELDLNKVGLKDPATLIHLDQVTITFGMINTVTNLRYVRLDDRVYTIEDVYHPLLSSHFSTLVSLNLLPLNSNIEKLELLNQVITKDEKGLWQSDIDISADNIINTINHWQHNQAFGVHTYLKRDDLGEVSIYIDKLPQAIKYIITDTDPWLILARPELGLEYHLNIEAYEQLINPNDSDQPVTQ